MVGKSKLAEKSREVVGSSGGECEKEIERESSC